MRMVRIVAVGVVLGILLDFNLVKVNAAEKPIYTQIVEQAVPCAESAAFTQFDFEILSSGAASVCIRYAETLESFSEAILTVEIQKRFLGVFWKSVDIEEGNSQWIISSDRPNDIFEKSFWLSEKGMYRAVIQLEIKNVDGSSEVIEKILKYEYQ